MKSVKGTLTDGFSNIVKYYFVSKNEERLTHDIVVEVL